MKVEEKDLDSYTAVKSRMDKKKFTTILLQKFPLRLFRTQLKQLHSITIFFLLAR